MSLRALNVDDVFLVTKDDGSESRHIQGQNLFSGVADEWYVLIDEGNAGLSRKLKVKDLVAKASDTRYMLVNRGTLSYKVKTTDVVNKFAITGVPQPPMQDPLPLDGTNIIETWVDVPTVLAVRAAGLGSTVTLQNAVEFGVSATSPVTTFNQNDKNVNQTEVVGVRWVESIVDTATHLQYVSGELYASGAGSTFSQIWNQQILLEATWSFIDLTLKVVDTEYTHGAISPTGNNWKAQVTIVGGTLSNIEVSVDGAAFTSSPGKMKAGGTIDVRGTTGSVEGDSYTAIIDIGGSTQTWTVETTVSRTDEPYIETPTIISPLNGSVDLSICYNEIVGSDYTLIGTEENNGQTQHKSSNWRMYEAPAGTATPSVGGDSETEPTIPAPWTLVESDDGNTVAPQNVWSDHGHVWEFGKKYLILVQYISKGNNATKLTSYWSVASSFETKPPPTNAPSTWQMCPAVNSAYSSYRTVGYNPVSGKWLALRRHDNPQKNTMGVMSSDGITFDQSIQYWTSNGNITPHDLEVSESGAWMATAWASASSEGTVLYLSDPNGAGIAQEKRSADEPLPGLPGDSTTLKSGTRLSYIAVHPEVPGTVSAVGINGTANTGNPMMMQSWDGGVKWYAQGSGVDVNTSHGSNGNAIAPALGTSRATDSGGGYYHSAGSLKPLNYPGIGFGTFGSSPGNTINQQCFGCARLLGVGKAGKVEYTNPGEYSSTGITINKIQPMSGTYNNVIYVGDWFVAVGDGTIGYSSDGINWTEIASPDGENLSWVDLATDGNRIVAAATSFDTQSRCLMYCDLV